MDLSKTPSRYAKACRDCATTKAKCIRQGTTTKCERCTRLNKECKARATTTRAPRPPRPNRLTQMERKLDGLVTLLAASQPPAQPPAASDSHPFLTPNSLSPDNRTCEFGPIQIPIQIPTQIPTQIPLAPVVPLEEKAQKCACSEPTIQQGPSKDTLIGIWTPGRGCQDSSGNRSLAVLDLNDEAAATLLENYQDLMAVHFPFVVIPANTTAQHLRISNPFLFLSVMIVSSYQKTGQQTTSSTGIMRLLSEKMLLKGEKSLDLLQGVLVYAAWYHSHRLLDPQLTNLLQLSIALLIDLGLNKAPYTLDSHQMVTDAIRVIHGNSVYSSVRSNDERRAFLGCFYLTAALSSCFKRLEALRYTSHVEENCNALSQASEYESDFYLVQLVKLQQIGEQITLNLPCDAPQSFWTCKPPIGMLVKAFQTELQSFRDSLPHFLEQDPSILLHYQSTTIHLFEISLCTPIYDPGRPSARLAHLHAAHLATTCFLTTFLSLPSASYASLPFTTWAQTLHAQQVAALLSLLSASEAVAGWDLREAEGVGNFGTLLDMMGQRFEEARVEEEGAQRDAGLAVVGSRYELYTQRMRRVKTWYEGKVTALATQAAGGLEREEDESDNVNVDVGDHGGLGDDFLMGRTVLDEFDDAYWAHFLGEWGSF